METRATISAVVRAEAAGLTFGALVESLRPAQWVKNGFVFAALIFARSLTDWHRVALVALAAAVFCLIASAGYLVNDVVDASEDRHHPGKRLRPVASGRLGIRAALLVALLLALAALAGAWLLDRQFFIVVASYAGVNLLYSLFLKHVMLLDVFVIAYCFLLRVLAVGFVIHVEIYAWLIVCNTLL